MIHIQGPDDLVAAPTKKEAERIAAAVNEFHDAYAAKRRAEISAGGGNPDHFPSMRAVVVPFDGAVEDHAASLAADWDGYVEYLEACAVLRATPSPGKAEAEDAARWRHARKAFWINGDPADVLCSSDADKAIDADMARDKQ